MSGNKKEFVMEFQTDFVHTNQDNFSPITTWSFGETFGPGW